jgi:hypothetical protein
MESNFWLCSARMNSGVALCQLGAHPCCHSASSPLGPKAKAAIGQPQHLAGADLDQRGQLQAGECPRLHQHRLALLLVQRCIDV